MNLSPRSVILEAMVRVAAEEQKDLRPLLDDAPLMTIGLDSLCFAILIARLEHQLGVDPFGASEDFTIPLTVGELIEFYEDALPRPQRSLHVDPAMPL